MKTTAKKLLTLALCLLLGAVMIPACAAGGADGAITWSYDETTQTLTIGGSGAIAAYNDIVPCDGSEAGMFRSCAPWGEYYGEAKTLVIEQGVTALGNHAYEYFHALQSVSLPDTLIDLGHFTFDSCFSLREITIPASVTSMGHGAFMGCRALETVTFAGAPNGIGHRTFTDCQSLKTIAIPEGVQDIGSEAFYDCTSLEIIQFPKSVAHVNPSAFRGCSALRTVNYGGTEADWNAIWIEKENEPLLDADIIYLNPTPAENENLCHWCGKEHGGGFDQIIAWLHSLLAKIFGARY